MKSIQKEIDKKLQNQIENYYDKTPFISLSKEKYVEYIYSLIKKVQIKDNIDLIDKIKNYTLSLIMNSSNYLDFVDYYINQNYSFTLNLNKILDYFKDLEEIFDNRKEMIDINDLVNLLKNNKKLYSLIEVVFKYYEKSIINNRINDSIDCRILISFIEAYCLLNNIELKEDNNLNYYNDVTNYDTNTLENFLRDIKKYKVLSREEERELITKAKKGDNLAKDKFICCNIRLVASIVLKHYRNREMPELDLIQEGTLGVIKALEKYDLNTNYKFSTYAYAWIKQYIDRALITKGKNIYIPLQMKQKIKEYKEKTLEFEINNRRKPTIEEISIITGYDEKTIQLIEANLAETISYDVSINEEEDASLIDLIPDENNTPDEIYLELVKKKTIFRAINEAGLTLREKDIIERRFGFNGKKIQTLESIGNIYGLSRERVRMIEKKALEKLKKYFNRYKVWQEDISNNALLRKNISKTIYDYNKKYAYSEVNYAISLLPEDYKNILYIKFGKDLKHPIKGQLSMIQERKFYEKILPKLNEILESLYLYKVEEKNEVNPKICEILWMLFRTYPFNELIFEISYDRLIVGLLESGYVDDIKYTDEAVANFLGKDKVDVYILNLEFKRRVYTNNLLSDIIENRDKYLKQVKEDKTKTI